MRRRWRRRRPHQSSGILPDVRFDIHVHHHGLDELRELLMAVSAQIQAFSDRVNAATNEIAADLKALRDRIASGLSAEDAALLDGLAAKLEAMGQDPETLT